jgi:hypothetical protein
MKTWILLIAIGLVTVLALGCASPSHYNIHAVATKPSDIKGSWIGYDQDCLLFYRLTFADKGKGVCVTLFADDTAGIYRIKYWKIKEDALVLELVPVSSAAESITMEVAAVDHREMSVVVKGVERSWTHQALLHREDDVFKRARLAQQIARRAE